LSLFVGDGAAQAQECVPRPDCDELNPECAYCPPLQDPEQRPRFQDRKIKPEFAESMGGEIGAQAVDELIANIDLGEDLPGIACYSEVPEDVARQRGDDAAPDLRDQRDELYDRARDAKTPPR